jgi:hypothetical protein
MKKVRVLTIQMFYNKLRMLHHVDKKFGNTILVNFGCSTMYVDKKFGNTILVLHHKESWYNLIIS